MSELLNEVKALVDEYNKEEAYKESAEFLAGPFIDKIKKFASAGKTSIVFRDKEDLTEPVINYFKEQGFKVTIEHPGNYHHDVTIDWSD